MDDLRRILLNYGCKNVLDKRVAPHAGAFHPVGIIIHHTGSSSPALKTVQKGRADLKGPLCHLNITNLGLTNVITDGLAWHAGLGSGIVLVNTKKDLAPTNNAGPLKLKDNTNGNPWYIGIEVDNDGVKQPYPLIQIDSLVWDCAALCEYYRWSANRIIHHREWTSRKIDMSYTGPIRAKVSALLKVKDL